MGSSTWDSVQSLTVPACWCCGPCSAAFSLSLVDTGAFCTALCLGEVCYNSQVAHNPSRGTVLGCVQGWLHRKAVLAVSHPCLALGCWGSSNAGTICSREP